MAQCALCGVEVHRLGQGERGHICPECAHEAYHSFREHGYYQKHNPPPSTRTIKVSTVPAAQPPALRGAASFDARKALAALDAVIVGQQSAKEQLLTAVHLHIARIHGAKGIQKTNVLLAGPTGTGKTTLLETLAGVAGVPFAAMESTQITPAGYVGSDITECLVRLYRHSGNDLTTAQHGIIWIDEIDKLAADPSHMEGGRGAVQRELLRMIEGDTYQIDTDGREIHSRDAQIVPFDTRDVLFIVGGAFQDLCECGDLTMGAIVSAGFARELIARFPIFARTEPLTDTEMVAIQEAHVLPEMQAILALVGGSMSVDRAAMLAVSRRARDTGMGARELRRIWIQLIQPAYARMCLAGRGHRLVVRVRDVDLVAA